MPSGVSLPGLPVETFDVSHSSPFLNTNIFCEAMLTTIRTPSLQRLARSGRRQGAEAEAEGAASPAPPRRGAASGPAARSAAATGGTAAS